MNNASDPHSGSQESWLRVARVGKPHGIRGEVTVELYTDDPELRFSPGEILHVLPGSGGSAGALPRSVTVRRHRWNKKICLLELNEITSRDAAEALRNAVLAVPEAEAETSSDDDDVFYSHELEGLSCVDIHGRKLGVVSELRSGSAQDLLVIETVRDETVQSELAQSEAGSAETTQGETVLVPFVTELVPQIDLEAGIVTLNPPPGLFPDDVPADDER